MSAEDFEGRLAGFRRDLPPSRERTPEWQARAEARKQMAQDELDRVYASKIASATEIKNANREWELADDELDFGPFPDSEI
jgi:transposase-like protein